MIKHIIFLFFIPFFSFAQTQKCDLKKLIIIHEKIDSLSFQIVEDFLYTFDESCNINVEFSEWSNELLYSVLDKSTNLFFEVLNSERIINDSCIFKSFCDPVKDYDYQKYYNKIKFVETDENVKNLYQSALIKMAKNQNLDLIK